MTLMIRQEPSWRRRKRVSRRIQIQKRRSVRQRNGRGAGGGISSKHFLVTFCLVYVSTTGTCIIFYHFHLLVEFYSNSSLSTYWPFLFKGSPGESPGHNMATVFVRVEKSKVLLNRRYSLCWKWDMQLVNKMRHYADLFFEQVKMDCWKPLRGILIYRYKFLNLKQNIGVVKSRCRWQQIFMAMILEFRIQNWGTLNKLLR